jgi:hypothetical protein
MIKINTLFFHFFSTIDAELAGINTNDRLIEINGENIQNLIKMQDNVFMLLDILHY